MVASSSGAPASRYGRRRPQRVRVRSEITPISGSVTASQSRATVKASPVSAGDNPTVSVKKISRWKLTTVKNRLPPRSPTP